MSDQQSKARLTYNSETLGQDSAQVDAERQRFLAELERAQERVIALSRTAAEVQTLLDPDHVLETIGHDLRSQGMFCFFGLLDESGQRIVLKHTNIDPETSAAIGKLAGVPPVGLNFAVDASPSLQAVIQEGKTSFETDVPERIKELLPRRLRKLAARVADLLLARQAIAAPLRLGADVLGLLLVWSDHLTEADVPAVALLAQQAAVAMERADLYGEAMQRVFEMEALRATTLDMTRQLDLPRLLQLIVERAAALIGTEAGALYLYHPEQDELEMVVSLSLGADYSGTRLRPDEGLSGRVLLTGEPQAVEDYAHWEGRADTFADAGFGGVLAVPLKWGNQTIGVLNVTEGRSPRSFKERELWLLEWFADSAALAIENARAFAERQRKIGQLAALHDVSLEVLAETDPSQLLMTIVQKATELLNADAGAIDLFDSDSQRLHMAISHGYHRDYTGVHLALGEGVAGTVCQTRQPIAVDDYVNWPAKASQVHREEISSALGVPLLRGEQLLGVLTIDRRQPNPFENDDLQLATLFANQAAIALENARLYHEQERRAQELLALYETSLHVVSRLEIPSLLTAIIARAVQLLGGEAGDIYLYRPETQDLISAASHQMPNQVHGAVVKPGQGLTGRILETRQPLIVDDYESWPDRSETYAGYGFAHVMGVPISYGDQFLGVVVVERDRESPSYTEGDLSLLTLFAHQAAVAIENSRLFEDTRYKAEELQALYEISTEIATQLDLPLLLDTIVRRALDLFDARAGGLYLLDSATQEMELIVAHGHTRDRRGIRLAVGEGACGKVAQSGEIIVINDYKSWDGRSPHFEDEPTCSVLAVPIKHAGTLLGALFLDYLDLQRAFDDGELRLANLLANQAAIAIENARLFADRENTIQQLAALQEVSLEVVSKTDLAEVLPTIVRVAASLLDARAGAMALFKPQSQELELNAVSGYDDALVGMRHAPGEGVIGRVAQSKKPLIVADYSTWDFRSAQWAGESVGTVMGVPLLRGDQLLGVLTIDRAVDRPFADKDVELATLFANQAAIAIQNAQTVEATRKRVAELSALREISLQLARSLDPKTVLETIVSSAVTLVGATDAHIFLYDQEEDRFTFGSGYWAPGEVREPYTQVRKNGLTATVARLGEPVVINQAKAHPLFEDETDQDEIPEAIAGFPLKRGDKVLGVFNVAFLQPHTFDEDELRVLTLLTDQAATAIENARLYQETDRRLRESQTLGGVSQLINSTLEPEQILQTVVEKLASAFSFTMASIYTLKQDGLHLGAQVGYDREKALSFIPLTQGVLGRVARTGNAELVRDVSSDPDFLAVADGVVAEIAVPIRKDDEVLGVLNVESTGAPPLTDDDVNLLSSLAHQVSVAMQNARLYQDAQRELAQRKRAEEEYRSVVEHSLQGLLIVQEGLIVFANQALADMTGYTVEQLLSLSPEQVTDLVHPEDQELVWGRLRDRLAGQEVPSHYEFRALRRDGKTVWAEMFANPVDYHGRPAVQGAIVDISERQWAEEALRESEERYRTLFEDSRDPVYITTTDGHFVSVNQSFLSLFGVTREELPGFRATDFYAESGNRVAFRAEIEARGSVRDYEVKLRKKDGTPMDALLSATLWRDPDGATLGYRGIIRDITEPKRAQEELERSYLTLRNTLEGTVNALAALAEARDPYTAGHQQRVAALACAIGVEMGLSGDLLQAIRMAGLVHDIGKIHVPAEILSKPTQLSDIEMQLIKTHPQTAYEILRTIEFPWAVADIVLQHHERLNGSGYPLGLTEQQILLEARIMAVADVVEAMASNRPYRPAHDIDKALAEISANAGILYDPQVAQACLILFREKGLGL